MSYTCLEHGWRSAGEQCPQCTVTVTTTGSIADLTRTQQGAELRVLPPNMNDLRIRLQAIINLLDDAHPGLMTWTIAYEKARDHLLAFYDPTTATILESIERREQQLRLEGLEGQIEEAEWWANGLHNIKDKDCYQCKRLMDLRAELDKVKG